MLEQKIIEHCAPTLAGLKTGNLFNFPYGNREDFLGELAEMNHILNQKGVFIKDLKYSDRMVLLYVYRRNALEQDLADSKVRDLLQTCGYLEGGADVCLEELARRVTECSCFPHEIGVFLSYPLSDVLAFIRHKGKNCLCCGIWSVYCDEQGAKRTFQKYQKCTSVYRKIFLEGRKIVQLTVAA